jgi:hypothetical protein
MMILFRFLTLIFFFAWCAPTFGQNIERARSSRIPAKASVGVKKQFGINDLVDFRLLREVSKEIEGKS